MSKETWDEIRESFEERIPCMILTGLIIELLILVFMIVFEYDKETYTDYFYLFSITILMLSTIYFAWHSLVKENAFELIAFMIMSTILNFHGVYQALADDLNFWHWIAIVAFCVIQIFYYLSFYFAYSKFGWRAVNEINTTNVALIWAYKLYETFISILKLDFLLYTMTVAMYIYYVLVDWNSFDIEGVVIGVSVFLLLIGCSWIGYLSVLNS